MPLSDARPYPRLTPAQKEAVCAEVVLYLALMARYRLAQHGSVATNGEQLELFSAGTSERLDVSNVLDV
jgi:hypothetical protein